MATFEVIHHHEGKEVERKEQRKERGK